ncbi:MAG: hypothetical protein OEQ16_03155 [Gammaproteobacteria bacterium]|nr:hypothetical protein [Gammaproteobacteria bacterium]MDH3819928.1 hypothetical protein [Gammaproteobacteria bacterium]MDH3983886.1 hypothetical protein [Gammaproteobacteria bacterium]
MAQKKVIKPVALAVGAALAGSFAISGAVNAADTADSPFSISSLKVGYMLSEHEGSCGSDHEKEGEGKCGEGSCGEKEGEGSCGEKEGEGSCGEKEGEGSCGEKEGEGSCGEKEGEGSCGEKED